MTPDHTINHGSLRHTTNTINQRSCKKAGSSRRHSCNEAEMRCDAVPTLNPGAARDLRFAFNQPWSLYTTSETSGLQRRQHDEQTFQRWRGCNSRF